MVTGIASLENAGELCHFQPWPIARPPSLAGAPPLSSLFKSGPFGSDPMVQIDGYPFGGDFAKEPPGFY
jgi:hypothetical protein